MSTVLFPPEFIAMAKKLPYMQPEDVGYCVLRSIVQECGDGTREYRIEIEEAPDGICALDHVFFKLHSTEVRQLLPLIQMVGQNPTNHEIYFFVRKSGWRKTWVRTKFWLRFIWHEFEWRLLITFGIWGLAEHEPGARVSWSDVKWPWKWFRRQK